MRKPYLELSGSLLGFSFTIWRGFIFMVLLCPFQQEYSSFSILKHQNLSDVAFIQCQELAGLFLPNLKKKHLPTFQQGPHGTVSIWEQKFFPLLLFSLKFTSTYLTFLLYTIFCLWVYLKVILHSLLHPLFLCHFFSLSLHNNIYIYIYIYKHCHPQTDYFVVSQIFIAARPARCFKLRSKSYWLYISQISYPRAIIILCVSEGIFTCLFTYTSSPTRSTQLSRRTIAFQLMW